MMATESPKERSDEASVTSEPEPTVKIDSDSHNVDPDRPHVNGDSASATDDIENKHISDIVDDLVNSSEVSISGGSDNEASKANKDGDKGHGRTSSTVKKPTSFKAINVNKTFLTTKGAAPSAPAKVSDKAASTAAMASSQAGNLTAARPRLIAKSGSGLVTKSSSGVNGGKAGSAPDPNVVWNKNRPVPPPEPKKYTDEELKKYGIHMANRLHPDDAKAGQANWADIDDDDDDWTPETITWQDGTKITLPHTEDHPQPPVPTPEPARQPPAHIQPPTVTAKENGITEKPRSPAPVPGTSPSVKPGVLASGKGLVLKGAPEKPTLVAKPPAPPTPVKSPWAQIPKVDKASPIVTDLPSQQSAAAKLAPKDGSISKSVTPPPPKEIAADDFSRAPWRDGPGGPNRELFNSQSGRYEPVTDRRGSVRTEPQHARQPALLQRSSHNEQQGPAEPSAAFQTSRTSDQYLGYGRRRGSSNVSGGSGSYLQRLKGHEQPLPPPELLNVRRESLTGASDSPASPRNFSPSGLHGGPRQLSNPGWQPRVSPATVAATPYHNAQPAEALNMGPPPPQQPPVATVTEQDLELQRRLMRERRELAMKRRLEEEAREEAARKERIRLKLEAMGPAPESKSARMAAAKDHSSTSTTPTPSQPRESPTSSHPTPSIDGAASLPEKAVSTTGTSESSKKPDHLANGVSSQHNGPASGPIEGRQQPHTLSWGSSAKQPDGYTTSTWGAQPTAKNVWGSPNNNYSLGNGTFSADLGTTQIPPLPSKGGPGPIAPPSKDRSVITSQASSISSSAPGAAASATITRQPPIGPPKQTSRQEQMADGGLNAAERQRKAWVAAVQYDDKALDEMLKTQRNESRSLAESQPIIRETWRPTKLDDSGSRTSAAPGQTIQIGQKTRWAPSSDAVVKPPTVTQQPQPFSGTTGTAVGHDMGPASMLGSSGTTLQQTRGSRFFPSRDVRQDTTQSVPSQRTKSPSPPPPDMAGHPAFDGDVTHPQVSLPRPQPVVRLPPAIRAPEPTAAHSARPPPQAKSQQQQGPSFAWANTVAYKENESVSVASSTSLSSQRPAPHTHHAAHHAQDNMWQARIDSLLGGRKTHSPPRRGGHESASRGGSGEHAAHPAPSMLFPGFSNLYSGADGSITTRDMAEGCFEEQEMGSLPPVRIPHAVPEVAWQPSPAPKPLPKKLFAMVTSAEAISFPVEMSGAGNVWRVMLPGQGESKNIVVPFGRARSNPRRTGQRGGGGRQGSNPHRGKRDARDARDTRDARDARDARDTRDTSNNSYPTEQGSSPSGPSNKNPSQSNRNSGRGGSYRGGRDNWSRNAAAPIQT